MPSAYLTGLRMLARRELSERQVRDRLARKDFDDAEIDDAVRRLRDERAIDDRRVAEAIARTAVTLKRRGRQRVKREIESAGIASAIAREAVDALFDEVDSDALLQAALGRRLREGRAIGDDREFNRLYRYLVAQGFETDRILAALNARRRGSSAADDGE